MDTAFVLKTVAEAINLREGPQGVRRSLWELHRTTPRSTRDWARAVGIPIPVIAALRGELESRGLLRPGPHPSPTADGEKLLEELFGGEKLPEPFCPMCRGNALLLPPELLPLAEILAPVMEQRPEADPSLDQSHAVPESSLLRALMAASSGELSGDVLFMGDDDLASVALALLISEHMPELRDRIQITVLDIDKRYLTYIEEAISDLDLSVNVECYDARQDLPDNLTGRFSITVTDPPYTQDGISLFAWRCAQAMRNEGGELYLAYAPQAPLAQHAIQASLIEQGWILHRVYPQACRYVGASVHANTSDLYHLRFSGNRDRCAPEITRTACYSSVYTNQLRAPGGIYRCMKCGCEICVGPEKQFVTIAGLKDAGCPGCGHGRFHRYGGAPNKDEN